MYKTNTKKTAHKLIPDIATVTILRTTTTPLDLIPPANISIYSMTCVAYKQELNIMYQTSHLFLHAIELSVWNLLKREHSAQTSVKSIYVDTTIAFGKSNSTAILLS